MPPGTVHVWNGGEPERWLPTCLSCSSEPERGNRDVTEGLEVRIEVWMWASH